MHLQLILVQIETKGLFGPALAKRKPWKKKFSGHRTCDEALQTLFKAAYFYENSLSYIQNSLHCIIINVCQCSNYI